MAIVAAILSLGSPPTVAGGKGEARYAVALNEHLAQASTQAQPLTPPGSARKLPRPTSSAETCLDNIAQVAGGNVCVSSVLRSQSGNSYKPENLFDNNPTTAWIEGVSGDGEGQMLVTEFDEQKLISKIELMNGYSKSADLFKKNGRVANIAVTTSEDERYDLILEDKQGWQSFQGPSKPARWIALTLTSVYRGSKYNDTAISGLRLR